MSQKRHDEGFPLHEKQRPKSEEQKSFRVPQVADQVHRRKGHGDNSFRTISAPGHITLPSPKCRLHCPNLPSMALRAELSAGCCFRNSGFTVFTGRPRRGPESLIPCSAQYRRFAGCGTSSLRFFFFGYKTFFPSPHIVNNS